MDAREMKEYFAQGIKEVEKSATVFSYISPFLPLDFDKLGHVSGLLSTVFLETSKDLASLLATIDELKAVDPVLNHYYLAASGDLAVSFNTRLTILESGETIQIVTFCREVEKALEFFSNGNCKLQEVTRTTTNQSLFCTVSE
jgi:hypothetical protein